MTSLVEDYFFTYLRKKISLNNIILHPDLFTEIYIHCYQHIHCCNYQWYVKRITCNDIDAWYGHPFY